jgi:hypothetical protein
LVGDRASCWVDLLPAGASMAGAIPGETAR